MPRSTSGAEAEEEKAGRDDVQTAAATSDPKRIPPCWLTAPSPGADPPTTPATITKSVESPRRR